ncbi:MAG: hypothetical protein ACI89L_000040 [Phycisphaerales bacterium]|jgi:hypothetical protein
MPSSELESGSHAKLIRLGVLALLVGFAIHIVANAVIKRMPPEAPSLDELRVYLTAEADSWAIVHGVRYLAIVSLAVFAAALFVRTCCLRSVRPVGWGVIGLLGAILMLANLMITNGIETLVFLDTDIVSTNDDVFWGLFNTTRVLFTAEACTWGVFIGGFSMAGWLSATLPKWLCALGLVPTVFGVLTGVFVVSILTDGWATPIIDIASLSGLVWFLCTGVYLLIRGDAVPIGSS